MTPAPAVVLLTAHAFDGDEARFILESQADLYEPKPIRDEDAFLAKLAGLIV
jgi:CheY-like chemotaxis protein